MLKIPIGDLVSRKVPGDARPDGAGVSHLARRRSPGLGCF
jgi:hypothetical protein